MSLSLYKEKRRFDVTPEPEGKEKFSKSHLRFVVQKHDASHLHYDFRLEMQGVLKSWAVPKGPSLNPQDKRLAMMVEDHPYDYRDFEGVIPEGNYGGGTVIVWDEGFYEPLDAKGLSRKEQEKLLIKQLYSGSVKIVLHGQKLKGEFALVLMKGRGERSWILIKHRDKFASEKDITDKDRSVKSGKSMMEVAADNDTTVNHPELHKSTRSKYKPDTTKSSTWKSIRETKTETETEKRVKTKKSSQKNASKKTAARTISKSKTLTSAQSKKSAPSALKSVKSKPSVKSVIPKSAQSSKSVVKSVVKKKAPSVKDILNDQLSLAKKSSMPRDVVPMLASMVDESFDDENWVFEIKWDGFRAVAYVDQGDAELFSRNLISFTDRYFPVTEALKELGLKAVMD
ncbi:MAG: DNA polymerase ligase N-terminal domain-containing protein, partial [Flavisolibacter sp.]